MYEVTFKIKPLEIVQFNYEVASDVDELTQEHVSEVIASNEGMVCWTSAATSSSRPGIERTN